VSDVVGPDDNGRVVTATPGGEIVLALPQVPGSGYRWALDPLPAGAELVDERSEARGGFGAAPGAGNRRVFTVRVGQPVVLRARLRRPWEPPDAAVEEFEVRVELPAEPSE
jgi:predicted secreted protein